MFAPLLFNRSRLAGMLLAVLLLLAACGRDQPASSATSSTPAPATAATATATAGSDDPARQRHDAVAGYAARIAAADHATIYRLDGYAPDLKEGAPIPPDAFVILRENTSIIATRACDAATAKPLLAALHDLMLAPPPTSAAACFEPAWGIDVYAADGTLIFHGMFCFLCSAYHFRMGDDVAGVAMPDGPEKSDLHRLLDHLLPEALPERQGVPAP